MFETIMQNKIKISIIVGLIILIFVGFIFFQSQNKQTATNTQSNTITQSNQEIVEEEEIFSPEEVSINPDYSAEFGLDLPKPAFNIAESLKNIPKIDKEAVSNLIPISEDDNIRNKLEPNVSILNDLYPYTDTDGKKLLPNPLVPTNDDDYLSTVFLLNDENKNLVNLGYGIDFYKVFNVDGKPFHIILKSDLSSASYIYTGFDLTKLTLLDTNVTQYFGLSMLNVDDTLYFTTYPDQNSDETETLKFSINLSDLVKMDLSKKIEIPQIPNLSLEGA